MMPQVVPLAAPVEVPVPAAMAAPPPPEEEAAPVKRELTARPKSKPAAPVRVGITLLPISIALPTSMCQCSPFS
jgi:hypothetical protein